MPYSSQAVDFSQIHPKAQVGQPINVLLVEDDDSDVMLAEVALENTDIDYSLRTLNSGVEVLPYLQHEQKYYEGRKPDVMLLDLSLPTMDGFEVLAKLAEQSDSFGDMPIVILTGDTRCAFLKYSYGLNIAAYITKPCSSDKITRALRGIARK